MCSSKVAVNKGIPLILPQPVSLHPLLLSGALSLMVSLFCIQARPGLTTMIPIFELLPDNLLPHLRFCYVGFSAFVLQADCLLQYAQRWSCLVQSLSSLGLSLLYHLQDAPSVSTSRSHPPIECDLDLGPCIQLTE